MLRCVKVLTLGSFVFRGKIQRFKNNLRHLLDGAGCGLRRHHHMVQAFHAGPCHQSSLANLKNKYLSGLLLVSKVFIETCGDS